MKSERRALLPLSIVSVILLTFTLILGSASTITAQGSVTTTPTVMAMNMAGPGNASAAGQGTDTTLTGTLSALHGDPQLGTGASMAMAVYLIDAQGKATYLNMDYNQAVQLNGQVVTVQGKMIAAASAENKLPYNLMNVTAIVGKNAPQSIVPQSITGSYPWISVLCRFSDSTGVTPQPQSYFTSSGLMSSSYPGINHYWIEQSYGTANINGTAATPWFNLPYPHSHYILSGGSFDLFGAATDCSNLAMSSVTFANFVGINFIFNGNLDCCAWGGGGVTVTQNGQTKSYRSTWMPPWGYETQAVMAHEMGHGFGLRHSAGGTSGGLGYPYTSDWDVMSSGGRACEVSNATYGCIGTGTIAYHKDELGWIPPGRKMTVNPGQSVTITIERLDLPASNADYLMAQIPIPGGSTFYTVESRFKPGGNGYDDAIRANAVIIHNVDPSRTEPAHVVDSNSDGNNNVNDASAEWEPGETFTDSTNHITVSVIAQGVSNFTVTIGNNPPAPTPTVTPLPSHIDSIGIYRNGTFYLRLHNSTGVADLTVGFNPATKPAPIVGDWTGALVDTVGMFDQNNGLFTLCTQNDTAACALSANRISMVLGNPNDMPLSGRWIPSNNHAGVGVFRPSNGLIYLRNTLTTGYADYTMVLGIPSDQGVAGDWAGQNLDSPGVYRPSSSTFYLSNQVINGSVYADITTNYGLSGDYPVVGDWVSQGHDGVGLFRQSNGFTYLKNQLTTGYADNSFTYGVAGDVPVAGHWQFSYPPIAPAAIFVTAAPRATMTPSSVSVPGDNQIGG